MIVETRGRYATIDEPGDDDLALEGQVAGLSDAERKMLDEMLATGFGGLRELHESEYDIIPPTPEEWLSDPFFGGEIAKGIYPRLREEFIRIHSGRFNEVYLTGALGWGKTFLTAISITYDLTCMLCLREPQQSYGLEKGTPLVFFAISTTLQQAGKGLAHDVAAALLKSPFFTERFKPHGKLDKVGTEIRFPKDVYLMLSTEGSNRTIGTNAIGGGIDESDFQGKIKISKTSGAVGEKDKARSLYEGAKRRAKSRFNMRGRLPVKIYVVSSKTTRRGMLVTLAKDKMRRKSKDVLVLDFATYMVKDRATFLPTSFKVFIGTDSQPPMIVTDAQIAEMPAEYRDLIEEVPDDFRDDFEDDVAGALADIAGIAVGSFGRFYKSHDAIDDIVDPGRPIPFTSQEWVCGGQGSFRWNVICNQDHRRLPGGVTEIGWKPKRNPEVARGAHIDTSLSDCATALAVGHVDRMVEVVRRRYVEGGIWERHTELVPMIWVDVILRILPPPGGEVDFATIRGLIYDLNAHGFNVSRLSTDTYQAADTHQQLKRQGIETKIISTDRTTAPHAALRQAINEGRVVTHKADVLTVELKHLELAEDTPGRYKVVKPSKFDDGGQASKDCADALACLVYWLESAPLQGLLPPPPEPRYDAGDNWLIPGQQVVPPTWNDGW